MENLEPFQYDLRSQFFLQTPGHCPHTMAEWWLQLFNRLLQRVTALENRLLQRVTELENRLIERVTALEQNFEPDGLENRLHAAFLTEIANTQGQFTEQAAGLTAQIENAHQQIADQNGIINGLVASITATGIQTALVAAPTAPAAAMWAASAPAAPLGMRQLPVQ